MRKSGNVTEMTWFDMSPIHADASQSVDVNKPTIGATSVNFVGGDSSGQFMSCNSAFQTKWDGTNYLPLTVISVVNHPVPVSRPWNYMACLHTIAMKTAR